VTTTSARRPVIVAHRGDALVAPEHTIPAYEAAVAAGADALWLDVQESADDQLVVIHDLGLERTTNGRGSVRGRTVRELKRLDAGRWFAWRFRGQRIQTLHEVLERFRGRARFVVALRAGSDVYPGVEERLVGLLNLYGAAGDTLVASYDHPALARCRGLDHEVGLGARVVGRLLRPDALAPPGVLTALCLDAGHALPEDIDAARAAGLDAYVGVVGSAADARRIAAWRPSGLVTTSVFDV
jgi:glycerophosphoryl diester phosphodiesterase